MRNLFSFFYAVLLLAALGFAVYLVKRDVAATEQVTQELRKLREKKPTVHKVRLAKRTHPEPVDPAPIIRVRSYKPKVYPKLRWWERKVITPVAITLTKKDNLERFHALLGRQVAQILVHRDATYSDGLACTAEKLVEEMSPGDVLITLGAGDSHRVGEWVLKTLRHRDDDSPSSASS